MAIKKKQQVSEPKQTTQSKHTWSYPAKNQFWQRIELWWITVISILLFLLSYVTNHKISSSILYVLLYIGLYMVISAIVKTIRNAEHTYTVSSTHMEINRTSRFKSTHHKIKLSNIKHHKLNSHLLAGTLHTKTTRHPLYFNTKEELQKYHSFITKHHPKLNQK